MMDCSKRKKTSYLDENLMKKMNCMENCLCVEKIYEKRVVNHDFTLTLWVPSYHHYCL